MQVKELTLNITNVKREHNLSEKPAKMTQEDSLDEELWNQHLSGDSETFSKRSYDDKESPQMRAFQFADARGGLPIFAKQIAPSNYSYMAKAWETFFQDYVTMNKNDRTFFEVIREKSPVNFYVDAELMRAANPQYVPDSQEEKLIIEETKKLCIEALTRNFPQVSADSIQMFEMDSSNDVKLSKHYIFRMKNVALENYITAGALYDDIALRIPPESRLWINNEKHPDTKMLFIDGGVYTRNRQFRLYQSKKFGSDRFLYVKGVDNQGDRPNIDVLKNTLITYFSSKERRNLKFVALKATGKRGREPKRCDGDKRTRPKTGSNSSGGDHWLVKELENLFEDNTYGASMAEDSTTINYCVLTKRCEIFGGEHESNHIRYHVDLITKTFKQFCFAAYCEGKTGEPKPIPDQFHPSIEQYVKRERGKINLSNIFAYVKAE